MSVSLEEPFQLSFTKSNHYPVQPNQKNQLLSHAFQLGGSRSPAKCVTKILHFGLRYFPEPVFLNSPNSSQKISDPQNPSMNQKVSELISKLRSPIDLQSFPQQQYGYLVNRKKFYLEIPAPKNTANRQAQFSLHILPGSLSHLAGESDMQPKMHCCRQLSVLSDRVTRNKLLSRSEQKKRVLLSSSNCSNFSCNVRKRTDVRSDFEGFLGGF